MLTINALAEIGGGGEINPSDAGVGSFRHIEGLKAGDKLRYISGPHKTPKKGEIVTVYSVL